jgi:2-oxoglutarate dehydrogenase E2 component (dihydrolipoamide succinyltransferase)
MLIEHKVPSPGESITEVVIETWYKQDGDIVAKDEALADIQSDKAMLTLYAEGAGRLKIMAAAGATVQVGAVMCTIDTAAAAAAPAAAPAAAAVANGAPAVAAPVAVATQGATTYATGVPSPAAAKLMAETGKTVDAGSGRDGRVTKADVVAAGSAPASAPPAPAPKSTSAPAAASAFVGDRSTSRQKMTQLRKTVATRLVSVKNETAMLTTFNEVDLSAVMELRKKYKEKFEKVNGIGLGFMGFFVKACCEALREFPAVNASIDHDELVYHNYVDMGIAVSTDRGLMVPVVRNAESKGLAQIEKDIAELAGKARASKLSLDEMQGGTFTVTNGGVFGSLLSTPILNPPQSGILGMHKIEERPIALNGQVVIRPMMYLALSYDHRIIDGKESVSFLVRVKEYLEDPARMILGI